MIFVHCDKDIKKAHSNSKYSLFGHWEARDRYEIVLIYAFETLERTPCVFVWPAV